MIVWFLQVKRLRRHCWPAAAAPVPEPDQQQQLTATGVSGRILILTIIQCKTLLQVCFNQFGPGDELHQCYSGHIVCGDCRPNLHQCPTCRGQMTGRATAFEQHLSGQF